jgi:hypothetical protein
MDRVKFAFWTITVFVLAHMVAPAHASDDWIERVAEWFMYLWISVPPGMCPACG